MFALGCTVGLVSVSSLSLMQSSVAPNLRGRVLGVWGMLFQGMFPIGNILIGTLAEHSSIQIAWRISAATLGLVAALLLFRPASKT